MCSFREGGVPLRAAAGMKGREFSRWSISFRRKNKKVFVSHRGTETTEFMDSETVAALSVSL